MKPPSIVAKILLGRRGYSDSRPQTDGSGYAVPYFKQVHANMCGEACVKMLTHYYGWNDININLLRNPRGPMAGMADPHTHPDYMNHFRRIGPGRDPWDDAVLARKLAAAGPLICGGSYAKMGVLGRQGHFVVLKGWDRSNFYVHCPWHGANYAWNRTEFANNLDDVWAASTAIL